MAAAAFQAAFADRRKACPKAGCSQYWPQQPLSLGWTYGASANDNGNVVSHTISGPGLATGTTLTQNYTYDAVSRLSTFTETGNTPNQSYNYDPFGNRWLTQAASWIAPGMSVQTPVANAFTNNQWGVGGGVTYDAVGNQASISGASRTFTFDGENRQITANIAGSGVTYTYDGEGRRVQKTTASGTTTYVYDAMGHLAAEYGGNSGAGGRVYLSVDALGSTRMVTDVNGNPTECYDYAPFGEELTQTIDGRGAPYSTNSYPTATQDAVTLKFTSKERDSETGLDYFGARYFSSAQGRFTSPDWSASPVALPYANLRDPQTLNRYSYVRNNPLGLTDPDGHGFWNKLGNLFTDASCFCEGMEAKAHTIINRGNDRRMAEYRYRQQVALFGGERNMAIANVTSTIVFLGAGAVEALGDSGAVAEGTGAAAEGTSSLITAEGASGWVRVGRWMSQEELTNMQATGVAQESRELGGSRVALPADSSAFRAAPSGDVYVEYDIPSGVARPSSQGQAIIPGPNGVDGRLAARRGEPVPQMPPVKNIEVKGQK